MAARARERSASGTRMVEQRTGIRCSIGSLGEDAHPEDAFIAEFLARVASRCGSRAEHNLARALAVDALDQNPELAYPWGRISFAAVLHAPPLLAQQREVRRGFVAMLRRALMRWLAETDRIERGDMRLMCRNVGSARTTGGERLAA